MQANEGENLKNSVPILRASASRFCFVACLMAASTWLTVAQTQKINSQQETGLSAVQALRLSPEASWYDRYHDKGLTVIGVHSPEFDDERQVENLRREVASLGISYPVVTDNDYKTWNAYKVEAWPTIFLLDKRGRIRWVHTGEGDYDKAEQLIQKLLAENET